MLKVKNLTSVSYVENKGLIVASFYGPDRVAAAQKYFEFISPKVVKCTEFEKEKAIKAAIALASSFSWDESKEGSAYWENIVKRLEQIAKDGDIHDGL